MTIQGAIAEAKEYGDWELNGEPSSVDVGYIDNESGAKRETQFDLWKDFEKELTDLWEEQYEEAEADIDGVTYVVLLGYINDF